MKIDLLKKNPKVCFEIDAVHEVKTLSKTCDWGMRYQSVIGFGEYEFAESAAEKRQWLDVIFSHYAPDALWAERAISARAEPEIQHAR